jgi:hypothetical protein
LALRGTSLALDDSGEVAVDETANSSAGHPDENTSLRYVDASRVDSPLGHLGSLDVRGADDQKIGRVAGVLIDPMQRRLRFFVVSTGRSSGREYLLPTDSPARMDPERNLLRVDVDPKDLAQCPEFSRSNTPDMSDDDMVAAMFARPA